jgi:homoserine dehydrogenase
MSHRALNVALLGFGTVGASVARILVERPELAGRLKLTHVFNRDVARKRAPWMPDAITWTDDYAQVLASAPDIVVEVVGGVNPAREWVSRAIERGSSVVTANKMLLAAHGPELLKAAATRGVELRFEAAVAGGVPLIHGVREGLAGDRLLAVAGILNGTCNYILSRMSATQEAMETVLADAQRLGYAEADPTADVDGHDAAAKLVVLVGVAFRRHLQLGEVPRRSIRPLTAADFQYAHRLGCTIRQISRAQIVDHSFHAWVGPALVLQGSSFGRNEGANNFVSILGKYGGETNFSGAGAGGPATAVAVVSDLLSLTADRRRHEVEEWLPGSPAAPPPMPYYLRFVVHDKPGILALIAASLSRQGVNVDALLQEPGYPKDQLPFVVTVEPCAEAALHTALAEINQAPWHASPPLAMPMLLGEDS